MDVKRRSISVYGNICVTLNLQQRRSLFVLNSEMVRFRAVVTHTHTHTHPFNGLFSWTTQVSLYQKGKKNQSGFH